MPGEYMKIGIGGQFNPDPDVLHFATVPMHCSVQKKNPMEFYIVISLLAAARWKSQDEKALCETQPMDTRRLV